MRYGYRRQTRDFSDSTFKTQLSEFFKLMKKAKIAARQNFMCCGGCGASQFGVDHNENGKYKNAIGYAFYHRQDTARLNDTPKDEKFEVYICYGWFSSETLPSEGHLQALGMTIASLAAYCGLAVEWDGQSIHRILVSEK